MMKKSETSKAAADKLVKSRQTHSAEEKIRIVLTGLRGEESISVRVFGLVSSAVHSARRGRPQMDILIGAALAKGISQRHGATGAGEQSIRKRLTRDQFRDFMPHQPPSSVVFEP